MDQSEMLKWMCRVELTRGDLKAIQRSRGFSARETASPELLRHVFLSERGVRESLSTLSPEEARLLHVLNALGRPVDTRFFTRIDVSGRSKCGYTFNERYGALFRDVRTRLVQKGLLLCATESATPFGAKETVLERKRFLFPPEFAPFLPPPCNASSAPPGTVRTERKEFLREKLAEILEPAPVNPQKRAGRERRLGVVDGELVLGGQPFRVEALRNWQTERFVSTAPRGKSVEHKELSPPRLTLYALSRLRPDEWVAPDDLMPLWKLACPDMRLPDALEVCRAGLARGCLEKAAVSGQTLFRLAPSEDDARTAAPEDYLTVANEDEVAVDLGHAPLDALELLGRISRMRVEGRRLVAAPALLKISHLPETVLSDPVFLRLRERHPRFGRTVATIAERRGKTIVHERLLIARVRDLGLKVNIEKAFRGSDRVVSLSKEFIAFPRGLLGAIEKLMKKTGHVVKRVEGNDET